MRKFFTLLFGMILGVVLVFGGVAGVGFWFVSKDKGMSDLDNLIPFIDFTEEIRDMNVLTYVKKVQELFGNITTVNIGTIEDTVGVQLSPMLAGMLGIDPEVIRSSNFETLPNKIVDSFTMDSLEAKFGITLPDMPMFKDPAFRSKPLMEAFNSLSAKLDPNIMSVSDLEKNFGIKLSDNPIFNDPAIANAKVANLGAALNEVQLAAVLGVVFKTDIEKYNASNFASQAELETWKAGKVAYANRAEDGAFDYFDTVAEQTEFITKYNATEPTPAAIMVEQWLFLREAEMKTIRDELNPPVVPPVVDPPVEPTVPVPVAPEGYEFAKPIVPQVIEGGMLTPPKESSSLIKKLSVNKLGDMTQTGGSDEIINKIINNSTLGEIIEIDPSDTLLYGLKDSKIQDLDNDIKELSLGNLLKVDESSSAAMKFLVEIPFRTGWKETEGSTPEAPIYESDEHGNRIPIYEQAKDAEGNPLWELDDQGNPTDTPIYRTSTINNLDEKIKQMVIGDILTPVANPEDQNVILQKVKYSDLDNLEKNLNTAIDSTTIGELIQPGEGEEPSTILAALSNTPISGLNAKLKELTIGDVIPAPGEGKTEHAIIAKLREKGTLVSDLGTELGTVIADTTLGELLTINESSSSIMRALAGTKTSDMDTKIQTLTLVELFGEEALFEANGDGGFDTTKPKGVLGLIYAKDNTTNLSNIAVNATAAMTGSTLSELRDAGLLPKYDAETSENNDLTAKAVNMLIWKDNAKPEGTAKTTLLTLPGAIIDLMLNTTLGELTNAGLITLTETPTIPGWQDLTVQNILDAFLNPKIPSIP